MQEHTVNSGWVRLLSPNAEKGRVPNPGREVPFLAPVVGASPTRDRTANFFAQDDQGFSILMTPDPNQRPYVTCYSRCTHRRWSATAVATSASRLEMSPQRHSTRPTA